MSTTTKPWVLTTSGKFQCTADPENCRYQHDDTGAMRLHGYKKHGIGKKAAETTNNQAPAAFLHQAHAGCDGTWQLLVEDGGPQSRARAAGYVSVCPKCYALRRD